MMYTYTPEPISLPSVNLLHLTIQEPGQDFKIASALGNIGPNNEKMKY